MRTWIFALALVAACKPQPASEPAVAPSPAPAEPDPEPASEPAPAAPEDPQPVGSTTPADPKQAELHALLEAMWMPNEEGVIPADATPNFQRALLASDVFVPAKGDPPPYDSTGEKAWMVGIAAEYVKGPSKRVAAKDLIKTAVDEGLGIYWDGGNVFTFMTHDELTALLAR
jgi:hypothetical protein